MIVLRKTDDKRKLPGILWIHGGGYFLGMADMVSFSRASDILLKYGATVISPEYRLAGKAPYPAALEDYYEALLYMKDHAEELGIRSDQLIVGGESAGGGLCAALCMYAKDKGEVNIAFQLPLYPMIDCEDTETSADNHARVWNTRRNHIGWKKYLGDLYGSENVPSYASASRRTDLTHLPPAYTFVCDGEPFYVETVKYIEDLNKAGVPAEIDVYHCSTHAFDMLCPWLPVSKAAKKNLLSYVGYALENYYAPQEQE